MALYHLSIRIVSRGKGKSAVAAAAYRAGEVIRNDYDGIVHDYSRKQGVVHTEIILPTNAPIEYLSRAVLWNSVEGVEKAKNSQLAREIEVALPVELSLRQNISLVHEYVYRHFVDKGMCADVCFHDTGKGNPHAHILLTVRPMDKNGEWGAKSRKEYVLDNNGERIRLKSGEFKTRKISTNDWNERSNAEVWREGWALAVNDVLERQGIYEEVDHRSFERKGIDLLPSVHLGVAASQMERKGVATVRGNLNRDISISNNQLWKLEMRIAKLQDWIKDVSIEYKSSALADAFQAALKNRESRGDYLHLQHGETVDKVIGFLRDNEIKDMAGLNRKVGDMFNRQFEISDRLKPLSQRIKALDEHIEQADIYKKNKPVYEQYRQIDRLKNRNAFEEAHRSELSLYQYAESYLKDYLSKSSELPVAAWEAGRDKLLSERDEIYGQYASLKEEVKEAEQTLWTVRNVIGSDSRNREKDWGLER